MDKSVHFIHFFHSLFLLVYMFVRRVRGGRYGGESLVFVRLMYL